MLNLAEFNPHLALARSESFRSAGDRAWEMFEAGDTVAEFVAEARANKSELEAAFGPLLSYPQAGRRL